MKEFITAVAAVEDDESVEKAGWIDFDVIEQDADGKEVGRTTCRARRPTPAQVAYLTASLHKNASLETSLAGGINFVMAVMDEDSASYLSDRLLDAKDPFDMPDLTRIIMGLIEEWSGKATESSLASVATP